ncbi:uncharacterized protein N7496_009416 [Penicillium cataractarum]|uniref:U-box domain-containing protein n=1 Tax=Penicillium cataractarum TaxID=2100454 RepID=A0A9W9RTT8_9EURO|nr:uncharacterized protein N7496_009416 [Penicillium cataractarum]KAJ5363703.1 hypothetical protein N7496_009416 [Penicillium cataractarum]
MAQALKKKGNEFFKEGDYISAEDYYSQAIAKDPHDATFFTNRAVTRIKLEKWEDVEHDARAAINIYGKKDPASLKSSVYLAEALLALNRPQEAYDLTLTAYQFSLEAKHVQTEKLSGMLLRAKKALWEARETARLHEMDETLKSLEELINADMARSEAELKSQLEKMEIGEVGYREDLSALQDDARTKISHIREAFKISSKGDIQERVVPDYLIDGITFEVMHDPVMTPSGTSFNRGGIEKYVAKAGIDPITREPMTIKDLRPNYALKAACEEFLTKNGWAVDW